MFHTLNQHNHLDLKLAKNIFCFSADFKEALSKKSVLTVVTLEAKKTS